MNCHDPFYFFLIAFKFINNLFRTPLNGIIGIIDINSKSSDMELIEENRQKARCVAQQLLSLLNEVLDMSRLEHGETVLTNELFHLSELTAALQDTMQIHAADSGIILICDSYTVPSNCERVYGNPIYIQKIFFNIIENAIKYNKTGGQIRWKTELIEQTESRLTYKYTISDTGVGMNETTVTIILPFTIANAQKNSSAHGNGNADYLNNDEFTPSISDEDITAASLSGKQILLVEDNELNREIATEILKSLGLKVDCAADGMDAVEIMSSEAGNQYDLIFMDIQMPKMDGYTATREIRTLNDSKKANIPIIAMTANAFDEDRKKAIKAGMNGHIAKPIDVNVILQNLDRIFGQNGDEDTMAKE